MSDLFLSIVRRRNTCETIQVLSSFGKFKDSTDSLVFYHLYDEDHRPLKRELMIEKEPHEDFGAELMSLNGGMFVCCVHRNSPAFKAGLQFGDQLLAANEQDLSNMDADTVRELLRMCVVVALNTCDSPLTRTYELTRKNGREKWGFTFNSRYTITDVSKNSPAARAGMQPGNAVVEVNSTNVILLNPKKVPKLLQTINPVTGDANTLHVTVMDPELLGEFRVYLESLVSARGGGEKGFDVGSVGSVSSLTCPGSPSMNGSTNSLNWF